MKLSVIVLVIFGLTYEVSSDEKITKKKGVSILEPCPFGLRKFALEHPVVDL